MWNERPNIIIYEKTENFDWWNSVHYLPAQKEILHIHPLKKYETIEVQFCFYTSKKPHKTTGKTISIKKDHYWFAMICKDFRRRNEDLIH